MAGSHRVLWVKVDMRKADADLMWLIGHELRHTIEVLGHRMVTNYATMHSFYSQMVQAQAGGRAFETAAAVEVGEAVRRAAACRRFALLRCKPLKHSESRATAPAAPHDSHRLFHRRCGNRPTQQVE
jgi:hypothetical protein